MRKGESRSRATNDWIPAFAGMTMEKGSCGTGSQDKRLQFMLYDRFTDRARKVMAYARQEAQRFNHDFIGTEHILLGLIKEGGGVAANVLRDLDVDVKKVRLEVERMMQPNPDVQTKGQPPFTPRAKRVIAFSLEEARALEHNYIGTEHILLGLLRENEGVAAHVLTNLGVKLEAVREAVLHLLGGEAISGRGMEARELEKTQDARTQPQAGRWSFADSAVEVLALAQEEARTLGQDRIGSEHLFLALLRRGPDHLTLALRELPVEPKVLYDMIRLKLTAGKDPAGPDPKTGDCD
jgi:ATP-dependent Clp protease ATP-binding subunit ClpA